MIRKKRKNFEIRFYEKILKRRPNFVHVLFCLGSAYTQRGFIEEGLAVDRRLAKLQPEDPFAHYNLACSLSLAEDIEGAFKELKKSILLGYDDFLYLYEDPDLENLRKNPRFKELSIRLKKLEYDNKI